MHLLFQRVDISRPTTSQWRLGVPKKMKIGNSQVWTVIGKVVENNVLPPSPQFSVSFQWCWWCDLPRARTRVAVEQNNAVNQLSSFRMNIRSWFISQYVAVLYALRVGPWYPSPEHCSIIVPQELQNYVIITFSAEGCELNPLSVVGGVCSCFKRCRLISAS